VSNCIVCNVEMKFIDGRSRSKKYCSIACLNKMRSQTRIKKLRKDTKIPIEQRLYNRIIETTAGCWEWQGARNNKGYGQVGLERKIILAHRASWTVTNGPIPENLIVRHICDNPPCINPNHLELGTYKDNSADAIKRNRAAIGVRHPNCVLSDDDVRAIRLEHRRFTVIGQRGYRSNKKELAEKYGVSEGHIKEIVGMRERKNVEN